MGFGYFHVEAKKKLALINKTPVFINVGDSGSNGELYADFTRPWQGHGNIVTILDKTMRATDQLVMLLKMTQSPMVVDGVNKLISVICHLCADSGTPGQIDTELQVKPGGSFFENFNADDGMDMAMDSLIQAHYFPNAPSPGKHELMNGIFIDIKNKFNNFYHITKCETKNELQDLHVFFMNNTLDLYKEKAFVWDDILSSHDGIYNNTTIGAMTEIGYCYLRAINYGASVAHSYIMYAYKQANQGWNFPVNYFPTGTFPQPPSESEPEPTPDPEPEPVPDPEPSDYDLWVESLPEWFKNKDFVNRFLGREAD